MRVIKADFEVMQPEKMDDESRDAIYRAIEKAGRVCYKTEYKIGEGSAEQFIKALVKRRHEAMWIAE